MRRDAMRFLVVAFQMRPEYLLSLSLSPCPRPPSIPPPAMVKLNDTGNVTKHWRFNRDSWRNRGIVFINTRTIIDRSSGLLIFPPFVLLVLVEKLDNSISAFWSTMHEFRQAPRSARIHLVLSLFSLYLSRFPQKAIFRALSKKL